MPERGQGESGQFEVLHAEGYPYDGDAKQNAESHMTQKYPYPSDEKPDNIHECGQAAVRGVFVDDFAAERPQGEYSQFQRLQAERDADDGDEQADARNEIFQCDEESAENQPDYISQNVHTVNFMW